MLRPVGTRRSPGGIRTDTPDSPAIRFAQSDRGRPQTQWLRRYESFPPRRTAGRTARAEPGSPGRTRIRIGWTRARDSSDRRPQNPAQVAEPPKQRLVACKELMPGSLRCGRVQHVVHGMVVVPSRKLPGSVQVTPIRHDLQRKAQKAGEGLVGGRSAPPAPANAGYKDACTLHEKQLRRKDHFAGAHESGKRSDRWRRRICAWSDPVDSHACVNDRDGRRPHVHAGAVPRSRGRQPTGMDPYVAGVRAQPLPATRRARGFRNHPRGALRRRA